VGPFEDNFQATTRDIAEKEQITNIVVCPSNPRVRDLNQKYAFNIAHSDILVSEKLVDLCLARGYKKILVFPGNWPLAMSLAQNFKRLAAGKRIQAIISEETHKPSDIDMTPQLIKMKPVSQKTLTRFTHQQAVLQDRLSARTCAPWESKRLSLVLTRLGLALSSVLAEMLLKE